MMTIKAGDEVRIKKEWQDPGDDSITWIALEDEDGGRVKIQAQVALNIKPIQVALVEWLEV